MEQTRRMKDRGSAGKKPTSGGYTNEEKSH